MWFVKEDPNAKIEISRLGAEIENLTVHMPEVLTEMGVGVDYLPIFSCMNGKMINCQLHNSWQAQCPFCDATPSDMMDGIDLPTNIRTLRNLPVSPLHVLLRTGEFFFKVGFRLKAQVLKYNVEMSKEEKNQILERYTFLFP